MNPGSILVLCLQCLMVFSASVCTGQDSDPDSLLSVYQDEQLATTERVQALLTLGGSSFARQHPDSILYYYERAELLVPASASNPDRSLYTYYRGVALYRSARYVESIGALQEAKEGALSAMDTSQLVKSLSYLGNCYLKLTELSAAMESFTEALLIAEVFGDQRFIVTLRSQISLVYLGLDDYGKSREYLVECLDYYRAEGDALGQIYTLTNIGANYGYEENYEKSLENHLLAFKAVEEYGWWENAGTVLINIGDCYANLGNTSRAKEYFWRGLARAKAEKEFVAVALGTGGLAGLYKDTKPDSARYYAQQALGIAQEIGNLEVQGNALSLLSELNETKGEYRKALAYYKEWKLLVDSTLSVKNERAIYKSEARYAYEKQKLRDQITFDQELAQQQLRQYLLLGTVALLIVVTVVITSIRKERSENEKLRLLHEMELIKERLVVQVISVDGVREEVQLLREKIETHLGKPLGDSSWNIICLIFENPTISNREIAEQVFLSLEGVSSSLRRMYRAFDISSASSKNLKVALVTKLVRLSMDK